MNLQLIRQWHDALLSGKYEQGRNVLRTQNDKFCCLGVLCDVVDNTQWRQEDEGGEKRGYRYHTMRNIPPVMVNELLGDKWMAIHSYRVRIPAGKTTRGGMYTDTLINLNDGESFTFKEIAECIRLTWPEAFVGTQWEVAPQ